jgi:hypothetical protein
MKSVQCVMEHWTMSIVQWKSGISKDFYAVNVIQKKSLNLILELTKE